MNEIKQDPDGSLSLRFYYLLGLRNSELEGPEKQKEQAMLDSEDRGYRGALPSTLARTRALVAEGKI